MQAEFAAGGTGQGWRHFIQNMARRTTGHTADRHFPYLFAGRIQRKPIGGLQCLASAAGKQGGRDGKHGIRIPRKPLSGNIAIFPALNVTPVTVQFIDMMPLRAIYKRTFEKTVRTAVMNFNRHGIGGNGSATP